MNQEHWISQQRRYEKIKQKKRSKRPKCKNRKIAKKKKPKKSSTPLFLQYTLGARSRVLHRHSQIVYSTNILAANQKTVFGGERLFFLGTFTVKKRHPLGIPLFIHYRQQKATATKSNNYNCGDSS